MEALVTKKSKAEDSTDKPERANATCAQDKNRQAQNGVGAGSTRALPSSYASTIEFEEQHEVHVASYAQAFDELAIPTFHCVE